MLAYLLVGKLRMDYEVCLAKCMVMTPGSKVHCLGERCFGI